MNDIPITAAVLITGNEVLSGRTQDVNVCELALRLQPCGIQLMEARMVRDQETAIIQAVNDLRSSYHYLFTTGGIGPTHDDITSSCIAKALVPPPYSPS